MLLRVKKEPSQICFEAALFFVSDGFASEMAGTVKAMRANLAFGESDGFD